MSFRTKFILTLLSATLTLYTAVGGWISTRAQQPAPANDPNAQLRIFESVLQHIQNDYVDEPNMEKVRAGALRGLAYGLGMFGVVGWSVSVPTLLGIFLGVWIDSRTDGQYSWTLMLMMAGLILGLFNAWYWVQKESQRD